MTKIASNSVASTRAQDGMIERRTAGSYLDLSVWATVFWLTIRQQCRARRIIILSVLFSLPTVIAILTRYFQPGTHLPALEYGLIFNLIPHALVPLTALLYACGMIQDEIEEQTLTYLLIRPLPKWAIYLGKLAATVLVTAGLAAIFTATAFAAIHAGAADPWSTMASRLLELIAISSLTLLAYCSIFGFISLYVRRSLVAGIAYIVVFESILANIDFVARRLTVVYYYRVLVLRWVESVWGSDKWAIDLTQAPSAWSCVSVLIGVSVAATVLACLIFSSREFRLKTPEGS